MPDPAEVIPDYDYASLLGHLRDAGFTVHADKGELRISPASKLTPADRDDIRACRVGLLRALARETEAALPDPLGDALALEAWLDPPDFDHPTCTLQSPGMAPVVGVIRESVILRAEGFPTVAVNPEALERALAGNRDAAQMRKNREANAAKREEQRQKAPPKKRRTG